MKNPRVHKINDKVYAITGLYHDGGSGDGVNAGIIFTEKSIIFIDSGMTISSAEFLWKTASERMKNPKEIYLILTHHHSDHVFGMKVFKERGSKVIAHEKIREVLEDDKGFYKNFMRKKNNWGTKEADIIFGDVLLSLPDQLITEDKVLNIDGEEIYLLVVPGHVSDEISVYHPKSKTLFAGDAVYEGRPPTTRFGNKKEWKAWIDQLERLKKLDIKIICPGHGELCFKKEIEKNIGHLKALL